jgi:hypothetical protein
MQSAHKHDVSLKLWELQLFRAASHAVRSELENLNLEALAESPANLCPIEIYKEKQANAV